MGTCTSLGACEACHFSEYNETLEFNIIVSNIDRPAGFQDSVDIDGKITDDSKSWWRFTKLLESDKSWDVLMKEDDKQG
jgi:hypothetical protein